MTTTTVSTIGSTGTYTTLQAWEDAAPASLVASDIVWQGQCQNQLFSGSTVLLTVSGSTTDTTRYKELTTVAGASFSDNASAQTNALRYNTANGAAISSTVGYGPVISAAEDYFRINKLQVEHPSGAGTANTITSGTGINLLIDKCIIECTTAGFVIDLYGGGTVTQKVTNCLLVRRNASAPPAIARTSYASLYNCTFVFSAATGANALSGNYGDGFPVENCGFFNCTAVKTGGGALTYTTCYTDAASPPTGCTTTAYSTTTGAKFKNITDSTRDYRIQSGSSLIDVGTTDSTNAAKDIVGTTRPQGAAYDVGAWEYVVSSTPVLSSPTIYQLNSSGGYPRVTRA